MGSRESSAGCDCETLSQNQSLYGHIVTKQIYAQHISIFRSGLIAFSVGWLDFPSIMLPLRRMHSADSLNVQVVDLLMLRVVPYL